MTLTPDFGPHSRHQLVVGVQFRSTQRRDAAEQVFGVVAERQCAGVARQPQAGGDSAMAYRAVGKAAAFKRVPLAMSRPRGLLLDVMPPPVDSTHVTLRPSSE